MVTFLDAPIGNTAVHLVLLINLITMITQTLAKAKLNSSVIAVQVRCLLGKLISEVLQCQLQNLDSWRDICFLFLVEIWISNHFKLSFCKPF